MYRGWLLLAVIGCNGDNDVASDGGTPDAATNADDAAPPGPCWPIEESQPGQGSIELGTGESGFQTMPEELPLVYGQQGGFHVVARARITGLEPGNPDDIFDPLNPRTRFRAFFVDTGEPIDPEVTDESCANRVPYVLTGSTYETPTFVEVRYGVGIPTEELFGRQVRVLVEIIDGNLTYASDEQIVTGLEPIGWADAGPGQ